MEVVNMFVLIQMEASIVLVILDTMEAFSAQVNFLYENFIIFYVDIDECQLDTNNCTQQCTNTDGSYNCSCYTGFILTSDNHTCIGWLTYSLSDFI